MNILVMGASGMAGHVISTYFTEKAHTVENLSFKHPYNESTHILNIFNIDRLEELLRTKSYDVVINCIGALVRDSELKPAEAVYLNSYLPQWLATHYKDSGTTVIHISSDAVFDGGDTDYNEYDKPNCSTYYGRTKALGEITNDKDITIRTSIVGPSLVSTNTSLFNWFWTQSGDINGHINSIWCGITTIELARYIDALITSSSSGICHAVTKNVISRFELLKLFQTTFNRNDITLRPTNGAGINSRLSQTRDELPHIDTSYSSMILEMKQWILDHKELYPHYANAS